MGSLVGNIDRLGKWVNSNLGVWVGVDVGFGVISPIGVGVGVCSRGVTLA